VSDHANDEAGVLGQLEELTFTSETLDEVIRTSYDPSDYTKFSGYRQNSLGLVLGLLEQTRKRFPR
jgi:hypothetical protein